MTGPKIETRTIGGMVFNNGDIKYVNETKNDEGVSIYNVELKNGIRLGWNGTQKKDAGVRTMQDDNGKLQVIVDNPRNVHITGTPQKDDIIIFDGQGCYIDGGKGPDDITMMYSIDAQNNPQRYCNTVKSDMFDNVKNYLF